MYDFKLIINIIIIIIIIILIHTVSYTYRLHMHHNNIARTHHIAKSVFNVVISCGRQNITLQGCMTATSGRGLLIEKVIQDSIRQNHLQPASKTTYGTTI